MILPIAEYIPKNYIMLYYISKIIKNINSIKSKFILKICIYQMNGEKNVSFLFDFLYWIAFFEALLFKTNKLFYLSSADVLLGMRIIDVMTLYGIKYGVRYDFAHFLFEFADELLHVYSLR